MLVHEGCPYEYGTREMVRDKEYGTKERCTKAEIELNSVLNGQRITIGISQVWKSGILKYILVPIGRQQITTNHVVTRPRVKDCG